METAEAFGKALVEFVDSNAWPIVVLVALFKFESAVRSLLGALSDKIARASRVNVGGKLGIALVEEVYKQSIYSKPANKADGLSNETEFTQLETLYNNPVKQDHAEHIAERHRLANRLGELALSLNKTRDIPDNASEGYLAAIATAVVLAPRRGDLGTLEEAAKIAKFNFTRYRIALALSPTLNVPKIGPSILRRVHRVLDTLEATNPAPVSESLQRLIDKMRAAITEIPAVG